MNAHDSLIAAILAALIAAPGLAGVPVEEEIQPGGIPEGTHRAISVRLERSDPQDSRIAGHPIDWVSTVVIECYALADAAHATLGRATRALHMEVFATLMASNALGGAASYVMPPVLDIDTEQAFGLHGVCIASYRIQHRTQPNTLLPA